MAIFMPQEFDRPWERLAFGILSAIVAILGTKVKRLRKYFSIMALTLFQIVNLHFIYLVYEANYSVVYVLGSMVIVSTYIVLLNSYKDLLLYCCVVTGGGLFSAFLSMAPFEMKAMAISGVLTVQIGGIASLSLRLKLFKNLQQEKNKSLQLNQQLIEKELESAEAVQKTLLSREIEIDGIEMNTFYRSADRTGGDWYGHYHSKNTSILYFWIGDVTGHGVSSALITGVACGALYSGENRTDYFNVSCSIPDRIEAMANIVNKVIFETGSEKMMTMLFCALELESNTFYWANAGHNFPYLVRGKERKIMPLINNGTPLGFESDLNLSIKSINLQEDDTIFAFTDGLLENSTKEGENLSSSQVRKILVSDEGLNAPIDTLVDQTGHIWMSDNISDDVSIMTVKIHDVKRKKIAV